MAVRPGGQYAGRPLHILWLLDCSGSMAEGGKIEALNNAIREVIPAMRKAAEGNPEVQFYMRVVRFSTGASWHIATPTLLRTSSGSISKRREKPTWARPLPCWERSWEACRRIPACFRPRSC